MSEKLANNQEQGSLGVQYESLSPKPNKILR